MIFLRSTEIGLTKECLRNYRRLGERFFCRYRARFSFYTAKTHSGPAANPKREVAGTALI
jgi:hypothetical protein